MDLKLKESFPQISSVHLHTYLFDKSPCPLTITKHVQRYIQMFAYVGISERARPAQPRRTGFPHFARTPVSSVWVVVRDRTRLVWRSFLIYASVFEGPFCQTLRKSFISWSFFFLSIMCSDGSFGGCGRVTEVRRSVGHTAGFNFTLAHRWPALRPAM